MLVPPGLNSRSVQGRKPISLATVSVHLKVLSEPWRGDFSNTLLNTEPFIVKSRETYNTHTHTHLPSEVHNVRPPHSRPAVPYRPRPSVSPGTPSPKPIHILIHGPPILHPHNHLPPPGFIPSTKHHRRDLPAITHLFGVQALGRDLE
jgi:hypothetical protein